GFFQRDVAARSAGDQVAINFAEAQVAARSVKLDVTFPSAERNMAAGRVSFNWTLDGAQVEIPSRGVQSGLAVQVRDIYVASRGFEVYVEQGRNCDRVIHLKPAERIVEAERFLRALRDNFHQVVTGGEFDF